MAGFFILTFGDLLLNSHYIAQTHGGGSPYVDERELAVEKPLDFTRTTILAVR